jgi:hypothetical protein
MVFNLTDRYVTPSSLGDAGEHGCGLSLAQGHLIHAGMLEPAASGWYTHVWTACGQDEGPACCLAARPQPFPRMFVSGCLLRPSAEPSWLSMRLKGPSKRPLPNQAHAFVLQEQTDPDVLTPSWLRLLTAAAQRESELDYRL